MKINKLYDRDRRIGRTLGRRVANGHFGPFHLSLPDPEQEQKA
ncbi:MAG: hypothetical protein ACOY3O_07785 [Thermodesulfobacteriota bacterium]